MTKKTNTTKTTDLKATKVSTAVPKKIPHGPVSTINDVKEASRMKSKEANVAERNFDSLHQPTNRGK